ncbi:uncharacterized protein N7496_003952 [Penicillium cataractarum]|uniref:Transcription factor domain-containing protein n=1 Tax=Penicillium cataractarum TaxID=2100454 RepID=A0A9W9SPL5_9EURO|nr:uncharacterized protein N7496_003952 [Penicillium cataractarum]KAJ5381524.1 hypothetical protein N7496_003952 [Penicillium cataractarum]
MASQAEYHPRSSDAARAGEALPDDFVHSFKQSLVADYKDFIASSDFVPFIIPTASQSATDASAQNIRASGELLGVNIDAESGLGQHDESVITLAQRVPGIGSMGVSDLNYPLSLFDSFPDPPPATIVEDLTRTFEVAFLGKVPFLSSLTNLDSSILAGLTGSTPVAPYLAFGRALIGTLVSRNEDCQRWASNLYKTTLKLFVGSVELDNRTSRNIYWYEAGILLVIYGTLGSDYALWETTNMVNGYFLAPYRRRGFLQIGNARGSLDNQDLSLYIILFRQRLGAFFCRILLEIGPQALHLPQIAGYHELAPDRNDLRSGPAEEAHFPGIHMSDIAVENAWNILEVLNDEGSESNLSEPNSENANEHHMIPLWLPLVVFYAGITVWARMQEDQDRGVLGIQSSPLARRQLLKPFHNELRSLGRQYKSASRMADVIKSLYP